MNRNDLYSCPVCGLTYVDELSAEDCCEDIEGQEGWDQRLHCAECGDLFDPDEDGLEATESPTGKPMCYECFNKRPCGDCKGL